MYIEEIKEIKPGTILRDSFYHFYLVYGIDGELLCCFKITDKTHKYIDMSKLKKYRIIRESDEGTIGTKTYMQYAQMKIRESYNETLKPCLDAFEIYVLKGHKADKLYDDLAATHAPPMKDHVPHRTM